MNDLHLTEDEKDTDLDGLQIGKAPEPTIFLSDTWCRRFRVRLEIGQVITTTGQPSGKKNIYVVKSYEDGWYKLQWPD